ncbi:MAG: thioredoxin fold domain-containing protein [Helicobacteraceae bacterium]|nr:thioredoxin fold domain-containing protein [Helicobacteraceae bacterium]
MVPINQQSVKKSINNNLAVMLYFSSPSCSVCHDLKPKIFKAIEDNFDEFTVLDINIEENRELAIEYEIFAMPTVLIFLDSKEFVRKSRNMSVQEVIKEIKRPYDIMMS